MAEHASTVVDISNQKGTSSTQKCQTFEVIFFCYSGYLPTASKDLEWSSLLWVWRVLEPLDVSESAGVQGVSLPYHHESLVSSSLSLSCILKACSECRWFMYAIFTYISPKCMVNLDTVNIHPTGESGTWFFKFESWMINTSSGASIILAPWGFQSFGQLGTNMTTTTHPKQTNSSPKKGLLYFRREYIFQPHFEATC